MEPYEGREPYIFISYARKDAERVLPYLDALSGAGYRVWYDAGIKAGEHWTETLVEKAEACAVFCPLFSEAFNASRFCFEETEYAYRKDKPIVPVYLEELKPDDLRPLYRLLESRQHLRLDDCNPAQFAERVEREQAFAPCKVPEWHKIGEIQWRFVGGVLTIAKNEDWFLSLGSIPSYQSNPVHRGSTAPWMLYREKILSVEVTDDIDEIGDFAFYECQNLTKVRIGYIVTEISDYAFSFCDRLMDVCIPESVTKIGKRAFWNCISLTNVHIPNSVTIIDGRAFAGCEMLTNVRISDSVTEIGEYAFAGCHSLTDVCIPHSVIKIRKGVFATCKSLTNVRIPDSVTEISDLAFVDCNNLKSVEIPAGAEVGWQAFPEHTLVIRRPAP
ncbi:MAG: leucine-rich repeat protein [Oscillibacter sp.]|nr:leucine-rich repeat protein [Oscillibacter sp.]